ncbi:MAG TPA: VC0807 family protein [Actinomycetota bacterium]|nr:VC0807 family protein [Actinomycetota bacterium]
MQPSNSGGTRAVLIRSLKGAGFGFIPLFGFYLGQRVGGVVWAVVAGCALTLAVFPFERKLTGSMRWSWIGLVGVAVSATLALVTHDPKLFFLRAVIGDAVWGLAMLGSLAIGRPLIAVMASWVVNIPQTYKDTPAYKRSFGLLTLVWGVVNVARAAGRGYYVAAGTLDQVFVMQMLTGWPVFAALVAFSVWYPRRLAHQYVMSIGGDAAMVDQILLGALEEVHNVELISGAEE